MRVGLELFVRSIEDGRDVNRESGDRHQHRPDAELTQWCQRHRENETGLREPDGRVEQRVHLGEPPQRFDGGAVAFLAAILSGREGTDFLVIEGDDFERVAYEPESGP